MTPTIAAPQPPALPRLKPTLLVLGAVVAAIYLVEAVVVRSGAFVRHPQLFAGAVAFDLTIFVPVLYWLAVVRRGLARWSTVLGVFVASLVGARLVLPVGQAGMLLWERLLVAPVELGIIAYVVVKIRRTTRAMRGSPVVLDVPERIALALRDAFPNPMVERALSSELTLMYFALASWRRPPHVPPGATAFTYHKKSGIVGLLSAVLGAAVVELFVVHLLVHTRAPRIAWTLAALSALGIVWLVGFIRALVLRPVLVTDGDLVVRAGAAWTLEVPRAAIERVDGGRIVSAPSKRAPEHLQGTPVAQPNLLVTLRQPLEARGLYGRRKLVRTVSMRLDEPERFRAVLGL